MRTYILMFGGFTWVFALAPSSDLATNPDLTGLFSMYAEMRLHSVWSHAALNRVAHQLGNGLLPEEDWAGGGPV